MKTRSIIVGVAAAAASLATAAPAVAQTSVDRGATEVTISSSWRKSLSRMGVRIRAARPATLKKGVLQLPIERGVLTGSRRYVENAGTWTLSRRVGGRTRKVTFREFQTTLRSRTVVTASVGGKRLTVLTLSRRTPQIRREAGSAKLPNTTATLSRAAASRIRRTLRLERLPRGVGKVLVGALLRGRVTSGAPLLPAATPAPPAPASATVHDVAITWHVRDSLVRYLAAGDGESDGTIVSGGAVEGQPTVRPGTSEPLVYDFHFPPAATPSWAAEGSAAFFGAGTLTLSYPLRLMHLVFSDPEIQLAGTGGRVIFRLDGGSVDSASRGQRVEVLTLDLTGVAPTSVPVAGGTRTTYTRIPAKVTEAGATALGGFYPGNDPFGSVTVSYTQ